MKEEETDCLSLVLLNKAPPEKESNEEMAINSEVKQEDAVTAKPNFAAALKSRLTLFLVCLGILFLLVVVVILVNTMAMNKHKATINEQKATINKQEATISKLEGTIKKQEETINQQEVTMNKQEATISQQEVTINEQEATINKQEATISQQEITINEQEATINKQEATISQQEITINEQEATINNQEATINNQEATIKQQEVTINEQEATINKQEATIKQQNSSINNLAAENTRLILENRNLTNQTEQLLVEKRNLIEENKQLMEKSQILENQTAELSREKNKLNWTLEVILTYENFPVKDFCPNKKCRPCLDGWTVLKDSCYLFYFEPAPWKTWEKSRQLCQNQKADLVVIDSLEEQIFLSNHSRYYFDEHHGYWLGLRHVHNNWTWVDGRIDSLRYWIEEAFQSPDSFALLIPGRNHKNNWMQGKNVFENRFICERKALIRSN